MILGALKRGGMFASLKALNSLPNNLLSHARVDLLRSCVCMLYVCVGVVCVCAPLCVSVPGFVCTCAHE